MRCPDDTGYVCDFTAAVRGRAHVDIGLDNLAGFRQAVLRYVDNPEITKMHGRTRVLTSIPHIMLCVKARSSPHTSSDSHPRFEFDQQKRES
jgi:hypothetical protein